MLILTMVWLMIPYLQSWFALWSFFIDGLSGKCDRDKGKIQRQHLAELEKLQHQEGLRLGKKLKMAHRKWKQQKMKVSRTF